MSAEIIHNHDVNASPEERMSALLEAVSSYIEQYHGGWVRMVEFDGKVLKVEMGGACGTSNFEGIAGVLGALEYLSEVGELLAPSQHGATPGNLAEKQPSAHDSMRIISEYERLLTVNLLQTLKEVPGVRIWGIHDLERVDERVPTVSFTMDHKTPREIAEHLGKAGIYVWDGNYYALAVTERLNLEDSGGMVRVGLVHYNTLAELERLREALRSMG